MRTLRIARSWWPFGGLQLAGITVNFGNAIAAVVYPWLVYDLSGNAAWMGVIAAITLFPVIAGMAVGGLVVERFGIRRMALLSALAGAIASVAAAAAYDAGLLTIGLLASLTLLGAMLDGPGGVAIEARIPEIARLARVPLMRANAIDDLIDNGAAIAGPAFAAFLVAVTSTEILLWTVAAINSASAILVALSLPRFRVRSVSGSGFDRLKSGLRLVLGTPTLRAALFLASIGTGIFVAFQAIALPAILRMEDRSAALLGLFLAAASAGAIVVNLLLAISGRSPSLRAVFGAAFTGLAAGISLLIVDRSPGTLIASGALLGMAAGPLSPVFTTLLQSSAPKELRANVIGVSMCLILTSAPLAALGAGFALHLFGAAIVLSGCAILLAACAMTALLLPAFRR